MASIKNRVNSAANLLAQTQGVTGEAYYDICKTLFGDFDESSPSPEEEHVLQNLSDAHNNSFSVNLMVQLQIAEGMDLGDETWNKTYKAISRLLQQSSQSLSQGSIDLSQSIVPADAAEESPAPKV